MARRRLFQLERFEHAQSLVRVFQEITDFGVRPDRDHALLAGLRVLGPGFLEYVVLFVAVAGSAAWALVDQRVNRVFVFEFLPVPPCSPVRVEIGPARVILHIRLFPVIGIFEAM